MEITEELHAGELPPPGSVWAENAGGDRPYTVAPWFSKSETTATLVAGNGDIFTSIKYRAWQMEDGSVVVGFHAAFREPTADGSTGFLGHLKAPITSEMVAEAAERNRVRAAESQLESVRAPEQVIRAGQQILSDRQESREQGSEH